MIVSSCSTQRLWLTLLETTRKLARDHGILGELYSGHISNRLTELTDDIQRIYKKVYRIGGFMLHSELILTCVFLRLD